MATNDTHTDDTDQPTDRTDPNLPVAHTPPAGQCERCGEPLVVEACLNCADRDAMGW